MAGFAMAYKGFDLVTERPVSIIVIDKTKVEASRPKLDYGFAQMRREAVSASRRAHPDILEVYDQFEDDQHFYVVSEFCEHPSLASLQFAKPHYDIVSAIRLFERILTIIQYLAEMGICGCAIRASDVFLPSEGSVKVENLFATRLRFIADLPQLGAKLARLAISAKGPFLDIEANERLDLLLAGDLLKALLLLAKATGERRRGLTSQGRKEHQSLPLGLMPAIDQVVQKLGDDDAAGGYRRIADLAEDIRAITRLFRGGSADETAMSLKSRSPRRSFLPGETIFREGDCGSREAFIIETGLVQILKNGADGRELYLDVSKEGEIIGEMALVDNQPRMATARAIEPTRVVVVTAEQFRASLEKTDTVSRKLIDVLVQRLRYQSSEITRLKVLLRSSK
ncbi:MAG TPA: cyclic nucleotide-binding domain-containing protein [Rhodospirillaceae bacterium]|nr:cyclic nucleotide-binding domain-containing protein [Rhodospirillaceae bacterium]